MFLAAYADESYDLPLGVYILTASLVDLTEAETIRDALHALQAGAAKLHWSKEPPSRRSEFVKAISSLACVSTVVVGTGIPLHTERARRKCLEALLPEVEASGITMLTAEARQLRNNKLDQQTVAVCRRKRIISDVLHLDFVPGGAEPLLWLPDIVCGAVLAAHRGDGSYLEQLADSALQLHIDAR